MNELKNDKENIKRGDNEKDFIEIYWNFFISLKLTVFLLLALTALSAIGTFVLQEKTMEELLTVYPAWLVSLFSFLGFFSMYNSTIFLSLGLLLSLNIIACSIDRFPSSWKRATRGDKFKYQPMGVYFVHLSLVVIFAGALYGQVLGFRGTISIPEGQSVNYIYKSIGGGMYDRLPLPYKIQLDKFTFEQFESGAPKGYKSKLRLIEGDAVLAEKEIEVNDPLEYEGVMFYQSSYNEHEPEMTATLEFQNKEGKVLHSTKAFPGESISPPGLNGHYVFQRLEEGMMKMGPAAVMQRVKPGEEPQQFVVFQNFPEFDSKNREDEARVIMKGFEKRRRFSSGIEVVYDPGSTTVFIGTFLMMFGLFISLYGKREEKAPKSSQGKSEDSNE